MPRWRDLYRRLAFPPGALAIVGGHMWVGTVHDTSAVTRVTMLSSEGRLIATTPVPYPAVNITPSSRNSAWVTFGGDNTVSPAALRITAS
jgi:hypothetical protein